MATLGFANWVVGQREPNASKWGPTFAIPLGFLELR